MGRQVPFAPYLLFFFPRYYNDLFREIQTNKVDKTKQKQNKVTTQSLSKCFNKMKIYDRCNRNCNSSNCKLTRDFGTSTGFELMAIALALQCSTQWLIQGRGYCRITESVWENQVFLKADHGLLCTSDLVYCFFELVSYSFQGESIKYMNSGRKSWL